MEFKSLGLSEPLLEAIQRCGYTEPTEIQRLAIPVVADGYDLAARSPTGTGKTLAFAAGLIERINQIWYARKALIFAPTRELTAQIRDDINALAVPGVSACAIYGGVGASQQLRDLSKPDTRILVATPRRLWDLTQSGRFNPSRFNLIVLDEADQLLERGFIEDIDYVMQRVARERQTLLFSATLSDTVLSIARRYLRPDFRRVEVGEAERPPNTVEEEAIEVHDEREKFLTLLRLIESEPGQILVFVAKRNQAAPLVELLASNGIDAAYTHKELNQRYREATMAAFKAGTLRVLVATDVAARGIDIPRLPLVIEYGEAYDETGHVHRAGRTGRMGKIGKVAVIIDLGERERCERKRRETSEFDSLHHRVRNGLPLRDEQSARYRELLERYEWRIRREKRARQSPPQTMQQAVVRAPLSRMR